MYEVGDAVEVRAFHVMPGVEGPEGHRHSHDYRIEVVVEREHLDERGMVCDLDVLHAALEAAADHVRDADLEIIQPPGAEAVTVEVFARWAHGAISEELAGSGVDHVAVRIYENPMAFGGFADRLV